MRASVTVLSTIAALLDVAMAGDFARAPSPDWILPLVPAQAVPSSGDAITVLSLDMQTRYEADRALTYVGTRARVETAAGLQLGNIALSWNTATMGLDVHEVAIERGDEVIDVLTDGQSFRVIDAEPQLGQAMIHGTKQATLQVAGLRVGDVLRLAYTVTEADPVLGGAVSNLTARPAFPDVDAARLRIAWADDVPVRWTVTGDLPVEERSDRDLVLELGGHEGEEVADLAPPRYWLSPRLELTSFADWEGVSSRFEPHFDEAARIADGSALAEEVEAIRRRTDDPLERADLALDLVQDQVRYLFSALEAGGYAPASAEATWSARYGDCKAKTALLIAILRSLDIPAHPALVSSALGDVVADLMPGHAVFDHVVVRAEIGGTVYWLDGTMSEGRVRTADLSSLRYALPITDGEDTLTLIEPPARSEPLRVVTIDVDASEGPDGDLPVTVTQRLVGAYADAARTAARFGDDQRKEALGFLFWDLDGEFDLDTVTVGEPDGEAIVVTAEGTVELDTEGSKAERRYVVPGGKLGWNPSTLEEAETDRLAPFYIDDVTDLAVDTTIVLPVGTTYYLDGLNTKKRAGEISLERSAHIEDGRLSMTASWRAAPFEVAPGDAGTLVALLRQAHREEPTFTATPSSSVATSDDVARLDEEAPDDVDGLIDRGNAYLDHNRFDDAEADFTAALELDPNSALALANRGMAYIHLHRREEAEADFDEALTLDPESWVALHGQGLLFIQTNDFEQAIDRLDRALSINPADDFGRYWRAVAAQGAGHNDQAHADADYLIAKWPENGGYVSMKAQLHVEGGEPDQALSLIERVIEQNGANAEILTLKSNVLERLERDDEALAALGEALELAPDRSGLFNARCWFSATRGTDLDRAMSDCEKALALSPDHPAYLDSRALVRFRQGDLEGALADYDAALTKVPTLAASLYGRSLVRHRLGEDEAAQADLAAARIAAPSIDQEFESYGLKAE